MDTTGETTGDTMGDSKSGGAKSDLPQVSDPWGDPEVVNPNYSQALRHFVGYLAKPEVIARIKKLAQDQANLEKRWYAHRQQLEKDGASEDKLARFDLKVHSLASRFANDMNYKLGEELGLPLFKRAASSPSIRQDRVKFMQFLSDLIAD